jgi:hypothetical protein
MVNAWPPVRARLEPNRRAHFVAVVPGPRLRDRDRSVHLAAGTTRSWWRSSRPSPSSVSCSATRHGVGSGQPTRSRCGGSANGTCSTRTRTRGCTCTGTTPSRARAGTGWRTPRGREPCSADSRPGSSGVGLSRRPRSGAVSPRVERRELLEQPGSDRQHQAFLNPLAGRGPSAAGEARLLELDDHPSGRSDSNVEP